MAKDDISALTGRCYAYAVVSSDATLPEGLKGLNEAPLEKRVEHGIAMVISKIRSPSVRAQRKHLSAHFKVIAALSAENDILPMTFGIIFDDQVAAREVLETHRAILQEQLQQVSNCVEMGLRLKWQGVDVFTAMVAANAGLRDRRDSCFRGGPASQNDLLDLGQEFERALDSDRDTKQHTVKSVLDPICAQIKSLSPADETVIANMACLVSRSKLTAFDSAVEKLGEIFDDTHLLEIDGPLPPFNFVDVRI